MTQEQLDEILDACKPVPYMVIGGVVPRSPQENANDAWRLLGDALGFKHMTVRPNGKGDRFFSAEEKDLGSILKDALHELINRPAGEYTEQDESDKGKIQ